MYAVKYVVRYVKSTQTHTLTHCMATRSESMVYCCWHCNTETVEAAVNLKHSGCVVGEGKPTSADSLAAEHLVSCVAIWSQHVISWTLSFHFTRPLKYYDKLWYFKYSLSTFSISG